MECVCVLGKKENDGVKDKESGGRRVCVKVMERIGWVAV